VIHTVGPVWRGGQHGEAETLAACYRSSIELADERGLKSLAFPAISTGVFGYPVEPAAKIALEATVSALEAARTVTDVNFVLFDPQTFAVFVNQGKTVAADRKLRFNTYTVS
jgi:O-acetyl-ADP-ribose deacetylase (regulator of RNase III)